MQRKQFDHPAPPAAAPDEAKTMKSVVQDRYGPRPEDVLRLAEIGRPTIRRDEVLVKVRAAGVDRGTWHLMAGLPYPVRLAGFGLRRPKYANPGRSLAGTVAAVGAEVRGVEPGDEVFGICNGSFAEYARVRTDKLSPSRRTCPSAKLPPYPSPASPRSRPFATRHESGPDRRC